MGVLEVRDEPFDRLRAEWDGLLKQVAEPIPFVTPVWQRVWLDHFQRDRELRLLTARDGERLVGVMPLLWDPAAQRAEFVGHYSICDYMDAVVTPGFEAPFFAAALEHLSQLGAASVELRGLREDSPTLAGVTGAAQGAGYNAAVEDEALSPAVALPESWEAYLGTLSKKDRHEMRRKLRRLDSAGGDVRLLAVTEPAEACAKLDTLFHLMRISSHHKEEFLERPGMETFFREMTAAMASEGLLRLYLLEFDGVCVASVLNFDVGGRLYMYNSGYDPAYSHYAVGLMSKAMLLQDAIEQGRSCVDFLRGDESYKYDLGGKDRRVHRLVLTK